MKERKALIFCTVKWKKTIKEMKDKKAIDDDDDGDNDDDVPGDVLKLWGEDCLKVVTRMIKNICDTDNGQKMPLKLQ